MGVVLQAGIAPGGCRAQTARGGTSPPAMNWPLPRELLPSPASIIPHCPHLRDQRTRRPAVFHDETDAAQLATPSPNRKARSSPPESPTTDRAAHLVAVIAAAVHHAHQRGILHRDLKPANILLDGGALLTSPISGWSPRRGQRPDATRRVGTPAYMAPNKQRTSRRDHRSPPMSMAWAPFSMNCSRADHPSAALAGRTAPHDPRQRAAATRPRSTNRCRSGDDLSEMSGKGAGPALSIAASWPRTGALPGRRADPRSPQSRAAA